MNPVRRAVIDVGTNSVKLLVAEVENRRVVPLHEQSEQTRLGRGFYQTHLLQPAAIGHTAETVATFVRKAVEWRAASVRVLATSAARDASNAGELARAIHHLTGLELEIISGEQEAHWAFVGISSDPRLTGHPLLIMDSGGGSTQLIYWPGNGEPSRQSLKVGAVRLLEKFPPSDPPQPGELDHCRQWLREFFAGQAVFSPEWRARAHPALRFVGAGGASSLLAAMRLGLTKFDRERLESVTLSREEIRLRVESLWGLDLERRRHIPGLPPAKADVVLMGAAIHEAVMSCFDLPTLYISTRGFRFAALME